MTPTPAPLAVSLSGQELLDHPLLNKGLGFTTQERALFGLEGLLPPAEQNLDQQCAAAFADIMAQPDGLARHIRLREIQDSNETLFYALLERHLEAILPLVYTPTVGEACRNFSRLWRRPRGLFLAYEQKDRLDELLAPARYDRIELVIVTDGERILGLGDLGANGMGIPIGKLSLYTACAGIDPARMLPVLLDTGTDNASLREDPAYIGQRHARIRGAEYERFVDAFVAAVRKRWPGALLHWEDFAGLNAAPLLERHRRHILSFNDDIQGTASIATAAILAAVTGSGGTVRDQTIVIAGGGSAGCGIAAQLLRAMMEDGAEEEEALDRFFMLDRPGLLTQEMTALTPGQRPFARRHAATPHASAAPLGLADVVRLARPTILIGVSGQGGLFDETVIRTMAQHCDRPLIFPLSNPTSHAEASPADLLRWTQGRAIVSTGSPFAPVELDGTTHPIDQTNNAYVFPGLGLGALACGAGMISDGMLMEAARAVASCSPRVRGGGALLPPISAMRDVALCVARAVARKAMDEKLCPVLDDAALDARIAERAWRPVYRPYRKA